MDEVEARFDAVMRTTYEDAVRRGYVATYFMQMIEEHDGVETAKRLLAKKEPQAGLFKLWELGLLDQSMEAHVVDEKYRALFTEEERGEARRRLEELGYFRKK